MEPQVLDLLERARIAVTGPMPDINVGGQCTNPYDCQFRGYCWPNDTRYPVAGLGGSKAKLADYVALGARDILDVDENSITAATQRRIYRVTCKGEAEILPGAKQELSSLDFPRYYLDFETIGPGVPIWEGTRPYQAQPVQWSCHIEQQDGQLEHAEFLDLSGKPPMRALAEALIACLGESGPVLMYTSFEKQVISGLAERFPDLADPLGKIINRLYDLAPVVKQNYYHPDMLGSWSIKAVMPTIDASMDYAELEGINEGTAASDGYLEAINPDTDMIRKLELEEQLLRYCRFDTEAMVRIVRFFT